MSAFALFEPPALVATALGRLAVRDLGGSRPPLLLWPALFTDHRLYARLIGLLRDRWRLVLIDGPGFGQSDPPRARVQPDRYASAVVEVMDALRIGRALFAGTSWGGQVGAHLAADHPDRVTGVLMMNTPLRPSLGGHLFEVAAARLIGRTAFYARGVARVMLTPHSFGNPEVGPLFTAAFASFRARDAARTASTTLRHFPGLGDVLARAEAPLTILMGGKDRLYPVESLMPVAQRAPRARIVVEPEVAHLAPLEAPQAVAEAMEELGARARPRRPRLRLWWVGSGVGFIADRPRPSLRWPWPPAGEERFGRISPAGEPPIDGTAIEALRTALSARALVSDCVESCKARAVTFPSRSVPFTGRSTSWTPLG